MSAMVLNANDTVKLKVLMKHYFLGAGHPMHVNWDLTHVDQAAHDLVADNRLMCSCHLLSMITGSELLLTDEDMRVYVSSIWYMCLTVTYLPLQIKIVNQL